MVAGHLTEKRGLYYAVLTYKDADGKRKSKWYATGLPVKGNKKRAEAKLIELRRNFVVPKSNVLNSEMLFCDFMELWLEVAKSTIAIATFSSYYTLYHSSIEPYFKPRALTIADVRAQDIQAFYQEKLKTVKATTVIHYHAILHRALKYAVKMDIIPSNPADKVERPKKAPFVGNFLDANEVNAILAASKGTKLELPILFGVFYGMRRSEILGLKWDCVDFEHNAISIEHTLISCTVDGKKQLIALDTTKTKSSMRTLPLVPFVRERLLEVREQQLMNRKLCGNCYNKKYEQYICVNEIGDIIRPNYITEQFPKFLERNGFRRVRFHDLRHTCVSFSKG